MPSAACSTGKRTRFLPTTCKKTIRFCTLSSDIILNRGNYVAYAHVCLLQQEPPKVPKSDRPPHPHPPCFFLFFSCWGGLWFVFRCLCVAPWQTVAYFVAKALLVPFCTRCFFVRSTNAVFLDMVSAVVRYSWMKCTLSAVADPTRQGASAAHTNKCTG